MKRLFTKNTDIDKRRLSRLAVAILLSVSLLTQSLIPARAGSVALPTRPAKLAEYPAQWGYQTPEPYYSEVLAGYQAKGYQAAVAEPINLAGLD